MNASAILRFSACAALALTLALAAPSCKTLTPDANEATHAALVEQKAELNALRGDPALNAEQRAAIDKLNEETEAALRKIEDAIAEGNAPPSTAITDVMGAIGAAIPGYGAIIVGVAGVASAVQQRWKRSKAQDKADEAEAERQKIATALRQTVDGIEVAKQTNPDFAAEMSKSKLAIKSKQDETTQVIVDSIRPNDPTA